MKPSRRGMLVLVAVLVSTALIHGGVTPPADAELLPTDAPVVEDAFVRGGSHGDTNYGTSSVLQWKLAGSEDYTRESFLTFDVSALDGPIGQATLWLYGYVSGGDASDYPDTVANVVYEVPDPTWVTEGITWNTKPASGASPVSEFVVGGDATQEKRWHQVDLTALVDAAVSEGRTEVGITIRREEVTGSIATMDSTRGTNPPRLEITHDTPLRSNLYPDDWAPGYSDAQGRFLHDFSYAGYALGQPTPQTVAGPEIDATSAPYGADPTGTTDSTQAIQAAIDEVGSGGGGTVYLPQGEYRVSPQGTLNTSLHIPYDGVLLRGAGPDATRLYNTDAEMHKKAVVLVGPDPVEPERWHDAAGSSKQLLSDVTSPTRTLHVQSPSSFSAGDWIVLRTDTTQDWLAEHPLDAGDEWTADTFGGLAYHRQVTSVDAGQGTIEIDVPTRYEMLTRDNARVVAYSDPVAGSGVADLAIGMRRSDKSGSGDSDYQIEGTLGYDAHQSQAILFNNAVDGWVSNVRSYRPSDNAGDFHLLSGGILVIDARNVTIMDTDMRKPQYRGGGGNGYLFHLIGSETLVRDTYAEAGRHNYVIQTIQATGNVILDAVSKDSERPSETHRHLSAANLFDNFAVIGDTLETDYRDCCNHAHSATQSVLWNTSGHYCTNDRLLKSQQFGWGYVIGTTDHGGCANVVTPGGKETEPVDYLEHQGEGHRLEPRSLYADQLQRRTGQSAGISP